MPSRRSRCMQQWPCRWGTLTYEQVAKCFKVRVSNVHVGAQVCVVDSWVGLCSVYLGLNVSFWAKHIGTRLLDWLLVGIWFLCWAEALYFLLLDQTGYEVSWLEWGCGYSSLGPSRWASSLYGHYEFVVILFGLTNVLIMFVDLMNVVFKECIDMFFLSCLYMIF